jgi:hypothetical protein
MYVRIQVALLTWTWWQKPLIQRYYYTYTSWITRVEGQSSAKREIAGRQKLFGTWEGEKSRKMKHWIVRLIGSDRYCLKQNKIKLFFNFDRKGVKADVFETDFCIDTHEALHFLLMHPTVCRLIFYITLRVTVWVLSSFFLVRLKLIAAWERRSAEREEKKSYNFGVYELFVAFRCVIPRISRFSACSASL